MPPETPDNVDISRHCAAMLEPSVGGKPSAVKFVGCFATFAEAINAGTDGKVKLPSSATPESITQADIAPAASQLIGIDYNGKFYTGRSYSWFATNRYGCLGGRKYFGTYLGSYFDNKLTSTRGFGFCSRNDSFTGYAQNGYFVRCFPNCTFIGSFLNNATSSKRWLP